MKRSRFARLRAYLQGVEQPDERHVEFLVARAELAAERAIAWTRIGIAALFLPLLYVGSRQAMNEDIITFVLLRGTRWYVIGFLLLGVFALLLVKTGRFRPWMSWGFVVADVFLLTKALHAALEVADISGNYLTVLPPVWAIPMMLAVGALRYRPAVQLCFTLLMAVSLVYVAANSNFDTTTVDPVPIGVGRFLNLTPSAARLLMLVVTGLILALVMLRARRLLYTAVREALRRTTLTRFLPAEIASEIASDRFAELRQGRRQNAVVMFVDIRDSTAMAERLDPHRLSIFIASFRRRVAVAARAHGAVIDKFVGDGAMLVFGLPEPRPDDAARALACAQAIVAQVERWNRKRSFEPPLRIGIGVHAGDMFCGLVGDRDRLEFTVLGDAVNVAARLEQMTKECEATILASERTVVEACATTTWREIARAPLRGRQAALGIYAPARATPEALPTPAAPQSLLAESPSGA